MLKLFYKKIRIREIWEEIGFSIANYISEAVKYLRSLFNNFYSLNFIIECDRF
jgi:8-oxo-dGTP pyrophosphatase MutT (NUDIX family)